MQKSDLRPTKGCRCAAFGVVMLLLAGFAAEAKPHPLDPLSADEITRAIAVIANSGRVNRETRAAIVTLKEPDKAAVLDPTSGRHARREAFAVLRVDGRTYEAVVDLGTETLQSWTHVPNVQPAIQSEEWAKAQQAVKADPRWQEAMRARDYTSFNDIFCESLSAGYFAAPEEEGRRLLKMPCYDIADAKANIYARPIEGIIAVVDLDTFEMIDLIDEGVVLVGTNGYEFGEGSAHPLADPMRPVRTAAPHGWNFAIDQRMVTWQGWSFHLGFDPRFGPVISLVTRQDEGRERMVLYQGFISEVFVPYMDDAASWAYRTYLDAGEFGLGTLASPLAAGTDCPAGAVYLDASLASPSGRATSRERVLCVFERDPGAPLWRHHEVLTGVEESRPSTELVVRAIPSVAHYDYVLDWVFTQGGEIRMNIGATGIDSVKGLAPDGRGIVSAVTGGRHGSAVAPALLAINHDHYFSLRLDLDIDGPDNRFIREHLERVMLPADNARRSLWQVAPETLPSEAALSTQGGTELWRIENPAVTTALHQHPGYEIQTDAPVPLLAPDDWPQRRAAFSTADLWITRRHAGELYAAGDYPNQSPGGDGLSAYANGEDITSGDLVVWCTIGFRHVPRPEDWPVLTTVWQGVTLRPYGFFTQNPALMVRRDFLGPAERPSPIPD